MIVFVFEYYLSDMNPLLLEYLTILFWYIVPCFCAGLIVLFIRFVLKPEDYVYRKVLHICAVSTILCFILPASTWWISVLDILTILFLINVTLLILERTKLYPMLFVDKSHHEILKMINVYYIIMAAMVALFFGGFGNSNKYLVVAAILAWGVGDAAAAIIGHKIGKSKYKTSFFDNSKSIEGTLAMLISSFLITVLVLALTMDYPINQILVESLVISIVLSLIEATTKNGLDNVFCPIAASTILLLFTL